MSWPWLRTLIVLLGLAAVLGALGYVVLRTAATGEDWIELAVIGAAALVGGLALRGGHHPRPSRRRRIVRTPEGNRWEA